MSRTIKVLGATVWPPLSRRLAERLRALEVECETLRAELVVVNAHSQSVDSAAGAQISALSSRVDGINQLGCQIDAINQVLIEVQGRLPPVPVGKKAKVQARRRASR